MGQSIQEWTKQNLWKTAFKKHKVMQSALADQKFSLPKILPGPCLNILFQIFLHFQLTLCFK